MKRIPSLQGFKDKLKQRADSKNRADPPAGTQSARKPSDKPPKFTLGNLKKIAGMSARGAQEPEIKPPATTVSKPPKSKQKDSSSDDSSSGDMENIIPAHHGESSDTKTLFLKIQFLEKENQHLSQKVKDLEKQRNIDKNIFANFKDKNQEISADGKVDLTGAQIESIIQNFRVKEDNYEQRILQIEKERDALNADILIKAQIQEDKNFEQKDIEIRHKEELQEIKDNLDRKEYLLQFNEQKYHQYEKVLRELILNKNTDESTKEILREKIESQELFVPKDERKITNLVQQNHEKLEHITILKTENSKLRQQLEEIRERGMIAAEKGEQINFMNQTVEQLSIFQNKEVAQFRNVDIEKQTIDKKYVKKLELSIENLNEKLTKLKQELQKHKEEIFSLKASNDNHIFINEKLNRALKKHLDKDKKKKSKQKETEEATGGSNFEPKETPEEGSFGGDLSSICITPLEQDQILNNDFMDDSIQLQK